jgi:hypothetical protein
MREGAPAEITRRSGMARTILYDPADVQRHYGAMVEADPKLRTKRAPGLEGRQVRKRAEKKVEQQEAPPADAPEPAGTDDYLSKIAKYVPAETVAVTTLGFGIWDPAGDWVWFWLAIAAAANVIYLLATALLLPPTTPRPRGFFYLLSAGAFFAWAIAVIDDAQQAAGITGDDLTQKSGFILAAAAFLIPALDTILSRLKFT